jgi:DNA-binding MarR family transcriptional regulator
MSGESLARTFEALALEVRLTFHQLRAAVEAIHHDEDGLTAAHRGVLESLHRDGPQSVPQMARARPVSRQHIQVLVNRLLDLGLVETLPNPAHRRSALMRLTTAGKGRFEQMRKRERRAMGAIDLPVSESRMRDAAETLRKLREALAAGWSQG